MIFVQHNSQEAGQGSPSQPRSVTVRGRKQSEGRGWDCFALAAKLETKGSLAGVGEACLEDCSFAFVSFTA